MAGGLTLALVVAAAVRRVGDASGARAFSERIRAAAAADRLMCDTERSVRLTPERLLRP